MLEELGALCSPRRVQELLEKQSTPVSEQDCLRAVKLLRKAAIASRQRQWNRSVAMVRLALEAVGRDKQLLRELLKVNNLSFIIIPRRPVARDRHGLVDTRVAVISTRLPRYGFAPR
jgi:hypothetical protein